MPLNPQIDIRRHGESQFGNDKYDLVTGYRTLRYAPQLKAGTSFRDAELSPAHHAYQNVAPLYIQAGGKEILVDMIRDFAHSLPAQGAPVRLDVWEHMTHEFHAYGNSLSQSEHAIECIRTAIARAMDGSDKRSFSPCAQPEVDCFNRLTNAQLNAV